MIIVYNDRVQQILEELILCFKYAVLLEERIKVKEHNYGTQPIHWLIAKFQSTKLL